MTDTVIFFIVVTFNGLKWIDKSIKSIYNNNCENIILIDNASTDGTVKYIKENFPLIKLIELDKNTGFGVANNIGIKIALENNCDYVFLLNQDAYLEQNTLSNLISEIRLAPNLGILSPLHLNRAGCAFDKGFLIHLFNGSDGSFVDNLYFNSLKSIYIVPFVNAAAWLISKHCLEKVGLFEPLFFHYGEDNNYCQRVIYHGLEIGITTNAVMYHNREYRMSKEPKFIEKEDLKHLLINVCDPFKDTKKEIERCLKYIQWEMLKFLIKIDFNRFYKTMSKYKFISSRKKDIINNTLNNKRGSFNKIQ